MNVFEKTSVSNVKREKRCTILRLLTKLPETSESSVCDPIKIVEKFKI